MDKKNVMNTVLILLLMIVLTVVSSIQPARASGAIFIRPDGSVEGTDKIQRDGDVYTFTGDIYVPPYYREAIVIERSNIIVDGDGHSLKGGSGYPTQLNRGFDLTARSIGRNPLANVTIRNTFVGYFDTGIAVWGGADLDPVDRWFDNHTIRGNYIAYNVCGIALWHNQYTEISDNSITLNDKGIVGDMMGWYTTISGNIITDNVHEGIGFEEWPCYPCDEEMCFFIKISRNYIMENGGPGISLLWGPRSNIICGNNIANNNGGLYIKDAWDNTISGNNIIANNEYGIGITAYSVNTPHNMILDNTIASHIHGIYMQGNFYDEWMVMDAGDNTISGNNITDNQDGVYLGSYCTDNLVSGNNITNNARGIYVSSDYNDVLGNNITNNGDGIYLGGSHSSISGNIIAHNDRRGVETSGGNNSVAGNSITNNGWSGISAWGSGLRNVFSGNNITYNGVGMSIEGSNNDICRNEITYNYGHGITMQDGGLYTDIYGNNITANAGWGIDSVWSGHHHIWGNNITSNNGGINLYATSHDTVSANIITENSEYGISLVNGLMWDTAHNIIYGNIITGHSYGIYMEWRYKDEGTRTYDNTVYGNDITDNHSGIELYDSSDNTFVHNNFRGNTQQVHDVSWDNPSVTPSMNIWDDGYPSGGNYWDDYSGADANGDGIGDTSYVIDGNNQDNYPLVDPWTPIVVNVVASDPDGSFIVIIDAGADKGAPITSWDVIGTCNLLSHDVDLSLDGMTITITGQLDNPDLEGQIVLQVDPEAQIITYRVRIVSYPAAPPTIESCDAAGNTKNTFDIPETVYVIGDGYPASMTFDFYIVEDVATWIDGMAIPSRVYGTATSISSDASGNVQATLVWNEPLIVGEYDIVVDVNGNGMYDEGLDALDDSDIEVTAGFNVIPEVVHGTIMASAAMIVALIAYVTVPRWRRKREHTNP